MAGPNRGQIRGPGEGVTISDVKRVSIGSVENDSTSKLLIIVHSKFHLIRQSENPRSIGL
jgi:hypothetical protein